MLQYTKYIDKFISDVVALHGIVELIIIERQREENVLLCAIISSMSLQVLRSIFVNYKSVAKAH